jgi:DNA-directed RNA polymerase specialized sigma24 family protein
MATLSTSQASTDFEQLLERVRLWVESYCRYLAYKYRYALSNEDIEDIYAVALRKLWQAYFSTTLEHRYQFRSAAEDQALFRTTLDRLAQDLVEFKKKHLTVSLNAPLNTDDDFSLEDLLVSAEVDPIARLLALEAIEEECRKARGEGPRLVAKYLRGELEREELSQYSDGYIAVNKYRFKKAVLDALMDAHKS